MTSFRYKAFISYSHRDEAWASWLHRALETYRIPRRLVGSEGTFGKVPAKLSPVFRDRDELSSFSDLNQKVLDALKASESLIVVCSPSAARSRWVNEEIHIFRSLGREDQVYCIIVDGEPLSSNSEEFCFPPALLNDEYGGSREPLAADARKQVDGKTLAKLKLVSGILGIRLDDLRRREQQRKRKLQAIALLASLFVFALLVTAIYSNISEKVRREHAETLVTQIVEISEGLDKDVDLETLREIGEKLAGYLDTLNPGDLTAESKLQIGLVLRQLGEVSRLQGRPEDAMNAFQRSRTVLNRLADESPEDLNVLFQSGQAEFWVAYIHLDRAEWNEAETDINRYLAVSQKLHEAAPENAEWTIEVAYALSNLGRIQKYRQPSDPDKALARIFHQ